MFYTKAIIILPITIIITHFSFSEQEKMISCNINHPFEDEKTNIHTRITNHTILGGKR